MEVTDWATRSTTSSRISRTKEYLEMAMDQGLSQEEVMAMILKNYNLPPGAFPSRSEASNSQSSRAYSNTHQVKQEPDSPGHLGTPGNGVADPSAIIVPPVGGPPDPNLTSAEQSLFRAQQPNEDDESYRRRVSAIRRLRSPPDTKSNEETVTTTASTAKDKGKRRDDGGYNPAVISPRMVAGPSNYGFGQYNPNYRPPPLIPPSGYRLPDVQMGFGTSPVIEDDSDFPLLSTPPRERVREEDEILQRFREDEIRHGEMPTVADRNVRWRVDENGNKVAYYDDPAVRAPPSGNAPRVNKSTKPHLQGKNHPHNRTPQNQGDEMRGRAPNQPVNLQGTTSQTHTGGMGDNATQYHREQGQQHVSQSHSSRRSRSRDTTSEQRPQPDPRWSETPALQDPARRGTSELLLRWREQSQVREMQMLTSLQTQFEEVDDPVDSEWLAAAKEKYRALIHDVLSDEMNIPEVMKDYGKIKIPSPKTYGGEDDIDAFENWLYGFVYFARINAIGGSKTDAFLVQLVGNYLTGKAQRWYIENVESVHRTRMHWTFPDVITELYARFVHEPASRDAEERYLAVKYSAREGMQSFFTELRLWASRMPNKPNPIDFMHQMLSQLPKEMRDDLIEKGYTPENNKRIKDLVQAGINYEQSERLKKKYNYSVKASRPSQVGSKPGIQDSWRAGYHYNPSSGRLVRDNQGRIGVYQPLDRLEGRKRDSYSREQSSGSKNRDSRDERRPSSTQATAGTSLRKAGDPKTKASSNSRTCYSCGQVGHYATDKVCPNFGQRSKGQNRLNAIDESEETQQSESEEQIAHIDESEDDTGGYGAQYESEIEQVSDYEFASDPESDSDRLNVIVEASSDSEEPDFFGAVRTIEGEPTAMTRPFKKLNVSPQAIERPGRRPEEKRFLIAKVSICGQSAITMFDSGSSTDSIRPAFAKVHDIPVHPLSKELKLQLATIASRASVNYGTWVNISYGSIKNSKEYVDVVNLDRYDAILGTPFMHKHGVVLDFKNSQILINGKAYPTLTEPEERELFARRSAMRKMHGNSTE
ncbi:hypothetical protein CC2G_012450 [Coprinopsis cinerea AmutBmut pab1-1]|nr:hypothetical protein CC2G_012450 [Coprinopsis cinerea AmutBmut pab1-1]